MSTRNELLEYLERRKGKGYSVAELMERLNVSESRARKHLKDMVEEGILQETPYKDVLYYGFVGVRCILKCDDRVPECDVFAHRCEKRERLLNEIEDVETDG